MTLLEQSYVYISQVYGLAGLIGKLTLLLLIGVALYAANVKRSREVVTAGFALQLLATCFLLLTLPEPLSERVPMLPKIIALAAALGIGAGAIWQEGSWTAQENLPQWRKLLLYGFLAWAVLFPVFLPGSLVRKVFFSPVGVLPHATLLAGCALVFGAGAATPRLPGWCLVAAAAILGLYDVLAGGVASSAVLIVAALGAAVVLLRPVVALGSIIEDDRPSPPPPPKSTRAPDKKPVETSKPTGPGRVWKLK